MAIMLIHLTAAPTLGTIQANQPSHPLKEIEDSIRKNPSWVPKNLFPSPSGPITVSSLYLSEYEFTLRKQNTLNELLLTPRLDSLSESPLYKSADFQPGASGYYVCHFTRAIRVHASPLLSREYRVSFGGYDRYRLRGRNIVFLPDDWKRTLRGQTVLEIWVEFSLRVSRRGFPILQHDENVRPIALRTSSGFYLVVLTKLPPNRPRKIDEYGNYRGEVFNIVRPKNSKRDTSRFEREVRTDFLQRLRTKFSSAPFHAELEEELPDEIIMVRNYKKNALLNDKYEQSGYVIRVFGDSNIGVFIRYSVLAANHPRNNFYDPTPQQFSRYKEAVINTQRAAQEETCNYFRGQQQGPTCIIRSR